MGVGGLWRGGDVLGRGGGLGSEGWGGRGGGDGGGAGCDGFAGGGGGAGCAFRVGCTDIGGFYGAVLYGICCRVCGGAVFRLACAAVRGAGPGLLHGRCLRLDGFCNGCHGHRRADHGRARDRAEQVVKGSFHSGASR